MAKMGRDLTSGNVLGTLLGFALPFFMSSLLQSLYGATDMFVSGQYCGPSVISAVSIGSQVMSLVMFVIIGIASGATVLIGQNLGRNDLGAVSRTIEGAIAIFVPMALVLTPVMILASPLICRLLQTPEEALGEATLYVKICSMGVPCIIAFNVLSAFFRGLGDSRTPMYIVAVAAGVNILGDLVLTGRMGMGASGVAIATVSAQGISSLIGLLLLSRKNLQIRRQGILKPEKATLKGIFSVGLPLAAQDTFINLSFIFLTVIANLRGLIDSSAVGVTEKVIMFMFLVPSAMLNSVTTITSQNYGAGKMERARTTTILAASITAFVGLCMVVVSWTMPDRLIAIFTSDTLVKESAAQYLKSYSLDTVVVAFVFCLNGYLCGIGKSFVTFLHSVATVLLVRIPAAYLLSSLFPATLFPMGLASPLASTASVVFLLVYLKVTGAMHPERG